MFLFVVFVVLSRFVGDMRETLPDDPALVDRGITWVGAICYCPAAPSQSVKKLEGTIVINV